MSESDEQKPAAGDAHKDFIPYIEHGTYVWYKTTRSKAVSINLKTLREQRVGTQIMRVVTNATTYDEAVVQLDRKLTKPPSDKPVHNKNQKSLFK